MLLIQVVRRTFSSLPCCQFNNEMFPVLETNAASIHQIRDFERPESCWTRLWELSNGVAPSWAAITPIKLKINALLDGVARPSWTREPFISEPYKGTESAFVQEQLRNNYFSCNSRRYYLAALKKNFISLPRLKPSRRFLSKRCY